MKLTSARTLRSLLLSSLFLLSFALSAPTRNLRAQETRSGHEFDYYSDDSYSCQVGVAIYCNDGSSYRSGQTTPYVIISDSGC